MQTLSFSPEDLLYQSCNVNYVQECWNLTLWAVGRTEPLEALIWHMYSCLYARQVEREVLLSSKACGRVVVHEAVCTVT